MWSSISAFSKDLGEFASVVSSDTKKLMGEGDGAVVAGDESTQLAQDAALPNETIIEIQTTPTTFTEPLTPGELQEREAKLASTLGGNWQEMIDPLIEASPVIQDMYKRYVEEREKVKSEDFFERYFCRMQIRRLRRQEELEIEARCAAEAKMRAAKEAEDEAELESWDEVGKVQKAPQRGSTSGDGAASSGDQGKLVEENAALKLRVSELEALVAALHVQVESLREENTMLKASSASSDPAPTSPLKAGTSASSGDASGSPTAWSPERTAGSDVGSAAASVEKPPAPAPAAASPAAADDDDDDDDWGSLT